MPASLTARMAMLRMETNLRELVKSVGNFRYANQRNELDDGGRISQAR